MQTERKYWFPAKRYGWGWGMPNTWQGWLVPPSSKHPLQKRPWPRNPPLQKNTPLKNTPHFRGQKKRGGGALFCQRRRLTTWTFDRGIAPRHARLP